MAATQRLTAIGIDASCNEVLGAAVRETCALESEKEDSSVESEFKSSRRFDASPEVTDPQELITRIKKLRWMGMADEVERLEAVRHHLRLAEIVFSNPCETD